MNAPEIHGVRVQVDRLCWAGIGLGLAFTMTNVQQFAAAGAVAWSLPWLAAWLLDPMVSFVLLAVLRAEQVTARCHLRTGGWVRTAKWFTLAATYVMNTWSAYAAGDTAVVVLHSVPPLVVFVAAEAITALRGTLTTAANAAADTTCSSESESQAAVDNQVPVFTDRSSVHERGRHPARRKSFGEYLTIARSAWSPDVEVTPAWARRVTGCSRGLSSRLAAVLSAEVDADQPPASSDQGVRP